MNVLDTMQEIVSSLDWPERIRVDVRRSATNDFEVRCWDEELDRFWAIEFTKERAEDGGTGLLRSDIGQFHHEVCKYLQHRTMS
jgi:hypothetical protein